MQEYLEDINKNQIICIKSISRYCGCCRCQGEQGEEKEGESETNSR